LAQCCFNKYIWFNTFLLLHYHITILWQECVEHMSFSNWWCIQVYVILYYLYNIYCVACTSASATSIAIPASALSLSDVAEESCCWALLRMSLAAELSRFSTGWASSARIYRRTTSWFRMKKFLISSLLKKLWYVPVHCYLHW